MGTMAIRLGESLFLRLRHLSALLKNEFNLFVLILLIHPVLFPYSALSDSIYSGGNGFSVRLQPVAVLV